MALSLFERWSRDLKKSFHVENSRVGQARETKDWPKCENMHIGVTLIDSAESLMNLLRNPI